MKYQVKCGNPKCQNLFFPEPNCGGNLFLRQQIDVDDRGKLMEMYRCPWCNQLSQVIYDYPVHPFSGRWVGPDQEGPGE